MKRIISFIVILIFHTNFITAQVILDMDSNRHVCSLALSGISDSIYLGDNVTVYGGTPPYTYCWYIEPYELFEGAGFFLHASNMLDDTTSANPKVLEIFQENNLQTFYLKLKVTDNIGAFTIDSIQLTRSWFYGSLMNYTYHIYAGDSIFLNYSPNLNGGIGPLNYLWQPSEGLSDATLPTGFWAKPQNDVNYYVTVTDIMGCQMTATPMYFINVNTLNIEDSFNEHNINVSPNPADKYVVIDITTTEFISLNNLRAFIISTSGEIIQEKAIHEGLNKISTETIPTGVYFIIITDSDHSFFRKKIIIEH